MMSFGISATTIRTYIRGVGNVDSQIVLDSPVGMYLDGVYMARSVGLVADTADIERVAMPLGEIAAKVDLHESTVSRVTSRKYMATPRGLFEFKHFFGSHVETAAGNPCSATAVRALITELVSAEEGERPLSDIKLTRLLEQRGIKVARRTVSKYRGALQIPSVEVRRMSYRPTQ